MKSEERESSSNLLRTCPICDKYGPLTQQHIRLVSELAGRKIPICQRCHDIVTRYEDEVQKALKHA